jgi:peptidoglycan lytic transglycosylase
MIVRFGAAVCVAAAVFGCLSFSTSTVKFGGVARGTTVARSLIERRAAAEPEKSNPDVAGKSESISGAPKSGAMAASVVVASAATASVANVGSSRFAELIARALGAGATITGAASTYNPFRAADSSAGGTETASGEPYDPTAWTGAIQTDLRGMFGGVHYGKDYRPCYALVAKGGKQVIIKINDVGTLEPGRVIDFNEQVMRYFDPTLERGLIGSVAITPLVGDGWLTGPLARND